MSREVSPAEFVLVSEIVLDPDFRLVGFSVSDLKALRRILDTANVKDLKELAARLGVALA